MSLRAAIDGIPFVDHHVHQPNKGRHVLAVEDFRRPFTEAALAGMAAEIAAAPERGIVGLKSIAAYRTGLAFAPPTRAVRRRAAVAYGLLREAALRGGSGRIADKDLVDTIVWTALEAAIPLR